MPMTTGQALGIIETIGLIASVEAADAAVKAANVQLTRYEKVDGAMVSIHVRGDVGSVQAAVDAGAAAARRVGQVVGVLIIPAPVTEIDDVVYK